MALSFTITPKRDRCFIFCFSSFSTISILNTFLVTFTIEQIIHCYKYDQNKTFVPTIPKKAFHWLNMTLNGSPSYIFLSLHVDFQTLQCRGVSLGFSQLFFECSVKWFYEKSTRDIGLIIFQS